MNINTVVSNTNYNKNATPPAKSPKRRKRPTKSATPPSPRKNPIITKDGLVVVNPPRFRCLVADPPWDVNQRGSYGAIKHYDLMSLEDIKNMPVPDMCEDNAICFLWVVGGVDGHKAGEEVLKAWGFDYKQDFVWVKPRIGMGHILRHAYEKMMVGVKGKITPDFRGQADWGLYPLQDHSHKPEEQYAMIERLIHADRYLELFARKRPSNKNWYIWGNEAEGGSDVFLPGYDVPEYSNMVKFAKEGDVEQADGTDAYADTEADIFTDADVAHDQQIEAEGAD